MNVTPRTQDATCGMGVNPVETPAARAALATTCRVLSLNEKMGVTSAIAEHLNEPIVAESLTSTLQTVMDAMSPNLLATVLPAYTDVEFATAEVPRPRKGIIRGAAWGLYPDRNGSTERRITTEGWEFFVTPETEFVYFRVLS